MLYSLCITVFKKWVTIWLRLDFVFNMSKYGGMHKRALKIIHDVTREVIQKRKSEYALRKKQQLTEEEENDLSKFHMRSLKRKEMKKSF